MQSFASTSTSLYPSDSMQIDSFDSPVLDEPAQAIPAYLKELASHSRKRSSSLLSTSSTSSSIFDFYHRLTPKALPSIATSSSFRNPKSRHKQMVSGSFVPSPTAAATALRLFLAADLYEEYEDLSDDNDDDQSIHTSRSRPRYTKHTSLPAEQLLHNNQPKGTAAPPPLPFITRSLSISSSRTASRSPSPPPHRPPNRRSRASDSGLSTSPRSLSSSSAAVVGLHPILARLERDSKFSKTKASCSACGKIGANYPRCGRCGDMWCSRSCRIGQAKKHTCRTTA